MILGNRAAGPTAIDPSASAIIPATGSVRGSGDADRYTMCSQQVTVKGQSRLADHGSGVPAGHYDERRLAPGGAVIGNIRGRQISLVEQER